MAIERLIPGTDEWSAFYANHIQRYMFAREHLYQIGATRVLDAACGVGYGARFLADGGIPKLVAIDRDATALEIAQREFSDPAIDFVQDDCHSLANAKLLGPFDAIVSFETIEHLPRPHDFLSACASLLRHGAPLIISTPNAQARSGMGKWDYHEQEFTASEFSDLIRSAGFSNLRLFLQHRTALGHLRDDIRRELNIIRSNPFFRLGRVIQENFRRCSRLGPPMPENVEEYAISDYTEAAEALVQGFVLIAIASRE